MCVALLRPPMKCRPSSYLRRTTRRTRATCGLSIRPVSRCSKARTTPLWSPTGVDVSDRATRRCETTPSTARTATTSSSGSPANPGRTARWACGVHRRSGVCSTGPQPQHRRRLLHRRRDPHHGYQHPHHGRHLEAGAAALDLESARSPPSIGPARSRPAAPGRCQSVISQSTFSVIHAGSGLGCWLQKISSAFTRVVLRPGSFWASSLSFS